MKRSMVFVAAVAAIVAISAVGVGYAVTMTGLTFSSGNTTQNLYETVDVVDSEGNVVSNLAIPFDYDVSGLGGGDSEVSGGLKIPGDHTQDKLRMWAVMGDAAQWALIDTITLSLNGQNYVISTQDGEGYRGGGCTEAISLDIPTLYYSDDNVNYTEATSDQISAGSNLYVRSGSEEPYSYQQYTQSIFNFTISFTYRNLDVDFTEEDIAMLNAMKGYVVFVYGDGDPLGGSS